MKKHLTEKCHGTLRNIVFSTAVWKGRCPLTDPVPRLPSPQCETLVEAVDTFNFHIRLKYVLQKTDFLALVPQPTGYQLARIKNV